MRHRRTTRTRRRQREAAWRAAQAAGARRNCQQSNADARGTFEAPRRRRGADSAGPHSSALGCGAPARAGACRSDRSPLLAGYERTARRKRPRKRRACGAHATRLRRAPDVAAYAVDAHERSASVLHAIKGKGLA